MAYGPGADPALQGVARTAAALQTCGDNRAYNVAQELLIGSLAHYEYLRCAYMRKLLDGDVLTALWVGCTCPAAKDPSGVQSRYARSCVNHPYLGGREADCRHHGPETNSSTMDPGELWAPCRGPNGPILSLSTLELVNC